MKRYFCTLFDKNYLPKGLALCESLNALCKSFHIWILCMDTETYDILQRTELANATLIKLSQFENKSLIIAKNNRSHGEYCWTCASSLLLYIFNRYPSIDSLSYLDADVYFFSSPDLIYKEIGNSSIMIIPHRFSEKYKILEKRSGIFNVGMVYFKNNLIGINCLKDWCQKCIKKCTGNYQNGIFGDQLYLNDWPKKFIGVSILKNVGANLAPWNINNYHISQKKGQTYVDETKLIFYHFHAIIITAGFHYFFETYKIDPKIVKTIYFPYLLTLKKCYEKLLDNGYSQLNFFKKAPTIRQNVFAFLNYV